MDLTHLRRLIQLFMIDYGGKPPSDVNEVADWVGQEQGAGRIVMVVTSPTWSYGITKESLPYPVDSRLRAR